MLGLFSWRQWLIDLFDHHRGNFLKPMALLDLQTWSGDPNELKIMLILKTGVQPVTSQDIRIGQPTRIREAAFVNFA